jgi:hypothetical protein
VPASTLDAVAIGIGSLSVHPSVSLLLRLTCMLFGDPIAPYQVCSRNGALTSDIEIIRKENQIREKKGGNGDGMFYITQHMQFNCMCPNPLYI